MVLELVKSATGAENVTMVRDFGGNRFEVLAAGKDRYGRTLMRRFRAVVRDGELAHLRGL